MAKAIVFLADGFEEVEAIAPIDFLRRAKVEVVTLGIGSKRIAGSHGIIIEADMLVSEFEGEVDAIVVPGGMPGASNIAASPAATELIMTHLLKGGLLAAICAAPAVVLYPLGALQGKRWTCFPGNELGLDTTLFEEAPVVCDGNIITSRAMGTSALFSLAIVEALCGVEKRLDQARRTMVP